MRRASLLLLVCSGTARAEDPLPTIDGVTVSPASPRSRDTLTCTPGPLPARVRDVVADTTWTVNGAVIDATGATLTGRFAVTDVVSCAVTLRRGEQVGSPVASAPVTIGNSPPVLASVAVEPVAPRTGDTVTCVPGEATDPDGDVPFLRVAWIVDGVPRDDVGLELADVRAGQVIACEVTPMDATEAGEPVSASVTVTNSRPSTTVTIAPPNPTRADPVVCTASPADPDGDPVVAAWTWTVDGRPAVGSEATLATGYARGQVVACTATPSDAGGPGAPASASVTVADAPPVITAVTLTPPVARAGESVRCAAVGADPDGDAVTFAFAWTVDGAPAGSTDTRIAPKKGAVMACAATPTAGGASGASASATLTVANSAPAGAAPTVAPAAPTAVDPITCVPGTGTDPDGDPVTWKTGWSVAGRPVEGPVLAAGTARKGERAVCTAIPTDGDADGDASTAAVTVANAPPSAGPVTVAPDALHAGIAPRCEVAGLTDPDGDRVVAKYGWTVDGVATTDTGPTLPVARVKRGARIGCAVTPSDGTVDGPTVSSAVLTAVNTLPVLTGAALKPTSAVTTDAFTCVPGKATDADGDAVSLDIAWTVGGRAVAAGETLAADHTRKGDAVVCTVTPRDPEAAGAPVATEAVVVRNTPPTLAGATLGPEAPTTTAALTCAPGATADADTDAVAVRYAWTVGGVAVAETGATLPADQTRKGQRVVCTATPHDGEAAGAAVTAAVTVLNTPPVLASAAVTPTAPRTDQDLTCETGGATDVDGDAVQVRYQWTVGGKPLSDTGRVLASSRFQRGDRVACVATPYDGSAPGAAVAAAEVEVVNSPPRVASAGIDVAKPTAADALTCVTGAATDPDGDPVTFLYAWTAGGRAAGTDRQLPAKTARKGEDVTCAATPFDGTDRGAAVTSAAVSVRNSAPVLSPLRVGPDPLYTDSTARAVFEATDADGDPLTITRQWTINGKPGPAVDELVGAALSPTLPGEFDKGAKLQVKVTVSDGDAPPVVATSPVAVVRNAPPDAPLVEVANPRTSTTDLLCTVAVESADRDGDAVSYQFAWTVDGKPYTKAATTQWKGDTVPKGVTRADQEWTCVATPRDPVEAGAPSEPVTVAIVLPTVGSGSSHACAIEADGTVLCWGLGDYQTAYPPEGRFRRLAVGNWNNCAIRRTRQLACWGHNVYGQSRPPEGEFREVSAGGYHACALDLAGNASCWGQEAGGRTRPPAGAFDAISAGGRHTCAITASGEVSCWGENDHGQIVVPAGGPWAKVSAGETHSCAIALDGRAVCWGSDDVGESAAPEGTFTEIVAGERFSCGLRDDGSVVCWGLDNYGQQQPPSVGFRSIGRGVSGLCGWTVEGELACWGNNQYGQARPPSMARE